MIDEYDYVGKSIGNYIAIAPLARGGFGMVYVGRHALLTTRMVAIKLLRSEHLTSQKERERFLQEAYLLEKLKHPSIVPVIDAGFHGNLPYIVTEYLPNGSLRGRLDRQFGYPLPVDEVMMILSQIGQALHYAHQQNIVHRDVKPANVLFNAWGDAFLADFGIATMLTSANIVQTATIIGSFEYMAPEQFQGVVSKECDQYALACVAYTLLTGCVPFRAPTLYALMYEHLYAHPLAPTHLNSNLPIYVECAILKAMAKQRTDRYPDIAAFLAALQGVA